MIAASREELTVLDGGVVVGPGIFQSMRELFNIGRSFRSPH